MYMMSMTSVPVVWVDLDWGSAHGRWAVAAVTYCPRAWWNIPNLSRPNQGAPPPWSPCSISTRTDLY